MLPQSYVGEGLVGIAAGPKGAVVIGFDHPISGLDAGFDVIQHIDQTGYRIWHSSDGITFSQPTLLMVPLG
ncbi:MAG TPA: hypothetical protein VGD71_19695, partial [Kribbella sp.]